MADGVVLYGRVEGVVTLTLNRPEKRNAMNGELVEELTEGLARARDDDDARVVALRGAGKDFCSGADLAELEKIADMGREESIADAMRMGELFVAMREHPLPIVAVVTGRALAGGCGLATACDLVVAHEEAQMGYPEVHLGFVPAMVMAILRRKLGESRAFDLVTGGHRIGLVNRVLPDQGFEDAVAELLSGLASKPASALRLTKGLLYDLDDLGFEEGIRRGAEVNAEARRSPECREGVRRFLERARG